MKKLTVEHLAKHLPYGLIAEILDYKSDYVGNKMDTIVGINQWDKSGQRWSCTTLGGAKPSPDRIKPYLYPLDSLTKPIFISGNKFVPADEFSVLYGGGMIGQSNRAKQNWKEEFIDNILYSPIGAISYSIVGKLLLWHFDIDGLLDSGLANDASIENPYK